MLTSRASALLLVAVASTPHVLAATADQWQSRTIYQLLTDRFATANGSSPTCDTNQRLYCGGTWQGVISKLDYIQNMGFDAVWISPVVANVEGKSAYGEAFHGYWTQDIYSVNSHFGTADDLRALSKALHDRKMYLMLDVVVNHVATAQLPPSFDIYVPFNQPSQYHPQIFIQPEDYINNQTAVEQGWLGDSNVALADLNTEDPEVVTIWNEWVTALVGNYSVDGLRVDTVKHVRKDFWPGFAKAAGVYTVGEVFIDKVDYLAPYTQGLNSVLDYSTYFKIVEGFGSTSGNLSAIVDAVQQAQSTWQNKMFYAGSFTENHDQPRFWNVTGDQSLVANAITWPFVQDGIPILYYGQEQSYRGGNDPANREPLWDSKYSENSTFVLHVKKLNAARRAASTLNPSFLNTSLTFPSSSSSANTLIVSKPPMLALLTNAGSGSSPKWEVQNAGYGPGEVLVDVLSCTRVVVNGKGGVSVTGSNGMPQVLLPANVTQSICAMSANSQAGDAISSTSLVGLVKKLTFGLGIATLALFFGPKF